VIGVFVGAALLMPPAAAAQGNGRPKGPKTTPSSPTSGGSSTSTPVTTDTTTAPITSAEIPTTVVSFRQFGTWLDDASAASPGEGYTSIGVGYWRMSGMSQTNVPMLGAGIGVTDRIQVSASLPFYRLSYEGGTASGVDDIYLGGKYTIYDPTLTISEFGLAISPVMEVLSAGAPGGRVHFAIPVSLELRRAPYRVYGSVGYFTRGSVFTGSAIEWTTPMRVVLTGALTQSYSVKEDATLDGLAVSRQRVDVMTSAAYPLGSTAAVYGNVGRSLSSLDEGGTSLALSGGISIRFAR
jgi:hypothetical protein